MKKTLFEAARRLGQAKIKRKRPFDQNEASFSLKRSFLFPKTKLRFSDQVISFIPAASASCFGASGIYCNSVSLFIYNDLQYLIALPDLVYDVDAFSHFPKYRMLAIQVLGVLAIVTDEKLRSAGISARMRHG